MTVARHLNAPQPEPPPEFREQVAAEIRAQLARRRMSGRALAKQLGETPTWVSRRLAGQVPLDVDDIQRIAEVLGLTPMELLVGSPFGPTVHRGTAKATSQTIDRVTRVRPSRGSAAVIPFRRTSAAGPVGFRYAA